MKQIMLLAALAGAGQASATGWEYAFLTEETGTLTWDTPSQALYLKTGSYAALLTSLKCKNTPNRPRYNLFNCVGQQGWEYMGRDSFFPGSTTYLFKRPKK